MLAVAWRAILTLDPFGFGMARPLHLRWTAPLASRNDALVKRFTKMRCGDILDLPGRAREMRLHHSGDNSIILKQSGQRLNSSIIIEEC
jgi:hypothetical protein